ncbi:MAG: ABC transporter substrate-binding protein, partial [Longimicrobiales bacterium]
MRLHPEALFFPLLLSLPGCGGEEARPAAGIPSDEPAVESGSQNLPIEITDVSGKTLALGEPPRRIVSLVPSASEILLSLGAFDRIVGRTDFDTAAVFRSLPSVGGGLHPNMEAILALEPDLVIRFAG